MDEIAILNFSDPLVLIVLGGTGFLFLLLLMAVRASMRTAKLAEPLAHQMGALGQRVQALGEGQERACGRVASRLRGAGAGADQYVTVDGTATGAGPTADE